MGVSVERLQETGIAGDCRKFKHTSRSIPHPFPPTFSRPKPRRGLGAAIENRSALFKNQSQDYQGLAQPVAKSSGLDGLKPRAGGAVANSEVNRLQAEIGDLKIALAEYSIANRILKKRAEILR